MIKKTLPVLFLATFCIHVLGGVTDDGFLKAGEYGGLITWRSYDPPLVVDGGGALEIQVRDNGCLIVESTSTPLSNLPPRGGVYDILLYNTAHLEYLNGVTEYIRTGQNTTATLKGGSINYIKTMRYATLNNENVFIYAKEDNWSWINNNPLLGIQGNWLDSGLPFRIDFINDFDYGPVWQNIKVIPEPATMLLLGLGGMLIRRKK